MIIDLKRAVLISVLAIAAAAVPALAQDEQEHSYSGLGESRLRLEDYEVRTVSGEKLRLSEAIAGSRLVLLTFFAAWCHNSKYDFETINELHKKFAGEGLAVIGICEYSSRKELKAFIDEFKPDFRIYVEGDFEKLSRTASRHYQYRTEYGDTRKWGTPFTVLFATDEPNRDSGIISTRQLAATGELVLLEAVAVIREKLPLKK